MTVTTKFLIKVDLDLKPSSSTCHCFATLKGASFCAILHQVEWSVRRKFVKFVHQQLRIKENNGIILFVKVRPRRDEYYIDKMWNELVSNALKQSLHLEKMMWNLSTLGGALSAMGDFIDEFVNRALEVSLKQRRIAQLLGDPVLISRCNMYIALSLAQKKNFPIAIAIIRQEYRNARKIDCQLLMNCAQGLLQKIMYMRKKNDVCGVKGNK
uniref:Uncharacterized protein n=1 Tax=Ditylenchus dipsaci TaxID=166011 RepID=A0A915D3C7_9BILA